MLDSTGHGFAHKITVMFPFFKEQKQKTKQTNKTKTKPEKPKEVMSLASAYKAAGGQD